MKINDVEFNVELSDILEELKRQLAVNHIELLQRDKDSGENIMVQCPYHADGKERRPSAGIRKSDGVFHCFACGETHTLPEVISHCFQKDNTGVFGWKWLLQNFATVKVSERKDVPFDFYRNNKSSRTNSNTNYVTEEELDKYRYIHPYMYKRGLTDEIIELFDIGYDVSTESITFPVRDISGNCLFVARRSVKFKWFNYPKGVEKPLYGLYEIQSMFPIISYDVFGKRHIYDYPHEIIVCESMLDALSFWTVGKYAVALNGLGNELQFKQLREMPCRNIILATDMDERGLEARKKIRNKLKNYKIVTQYFFPDGKKDANECTREELLNLHDVF